MYVIMWRLYLETKVLGAEGLLFGYTESDPYSS